MVKNISLPVNSRKIATLLKTDIEMQGYVVNEIKIRTTLSDEGFDNLFTAIKQMKDRKIIPSEYKLSDKVKADLLAQDFLEKEEESVHVQHEEQYIQSRLQSTDEETQFNNFKNKAMKGSSSKIPSIEEELDRFEQKYSKPMKYLREEIQNLSDLQAYAIIFATDNLGLRESSKDRVYNYLFNRHYKAKQFYEKMGISIEFPISTGMNFIDLGREFSLSAEVVELGQNIKTLSGLDTYSESVLEEFFIQLLTDRLTRELYEKKVFWRWSKKYNENLLDYTLPPIKNQIPKSKYHKLRIISITQLLLFAIDPLNEVTFEQLHAQVKDLDYNESSNIFAKLITKELIVKTLEKQVGVTLSNYFRDLQTNPGTVDAFCVVVLRFYDKLNNTTYFVDSLVDNIRSGLLNSTGMLKNRLNKLSYDDIDVLIRKSVTTANIEFPQKDENENKRVKIVKNTLKTIYANIKQSFETKTSGVAVQKKGGMKEQITTFWDSVDYLVTNSAEFIEVANSLVDTNLENDIITTILKVTSYITYRIAGRNDIDGKMLHQDLANYFAKKYYELGNIELRNGQTLIQTAHFNNYIKEELVEASVIVSLGSKVYSACINAWPSLKSLSKNTQLLLDFVIPNILFWQRLPRKLIHALQDEGLYDNSIIRPLIEKTKRVNAVEAYSLLLFGLSSQFKTMNDAKAHIMFSLKIDKEEELKLHPRTGEAEIIHDVISLWDTVKSFAELDNELSKFTTPPVELALNISKGFAREFNGRDWFNQIYFAKLSVSQEEEGFIPLLYQFEFEHDENDNIPSNLLMTYYYPDTHSNSITQLAGIIIIGGEPRIEAAFQITKTLTPVLEALSLDRFPITLTPHKQLIANTLLKISNNITVRGMSEILEALEEKSKEQIKNFYPVLGDTNYKQQLLALPNDFKLHAIIILEITKEFFHTEIMGAGIKKLSLYRDETVEDKITGSDAFPLIIKWQPLYNDIQTELQKYGTGILPKTYTGHVKPKIIIFRTQNHITGLITKVAKVADRYYLNVGIARSGANNGQPLSLLQIQLSREKFGSKEWKERVSQNYKSSDAISYNLSKILEDEELLDEDGMLDLGKIKSLQQ